MTENEARYIARMLDAYKENILFTDATHEDDKLLDIMRERYREGGRFQAGSEAARIWLIMYVSENGVPGGEYIDDHHIDRYLFQREVPRIERPLEEPPQ